MKKIWFYVLLVVVFASSSYAEDVFAEEAIKIYLNGERLVVSIDPIVESGITLVPMRSIFEGLGMEVKWDSSTQTVTGTGNNVATKITIGENRAYVDGSEVNLPVSAKVIGGTTMVPIRFVAESARSEVQWDGSSKTINITLNNYEVTTADSDGFYVVKGTGEHSGYMELKGYPDEDKYRIYFKGDASSYHVTYDDLRGIDLNEIIAWESNGENYQSKRSDLYVYFSDTTWFRNNLNGITDYTLTTEWFMDTFGDTYSEWSRGLLGYSSEASRFVQDYFEQTSPSGKGNVTLTPDAEFEVIGEDPNEVFKEQGEEASLDFLNKQIEAAKITETWIDEDTLYRKADISIGADASGNPILDRIIYGPYELAGRKKLHAYTLPENWQTGDQNETIVGGIRMKREGNTDYYYIDDLYKANIIPENFNEEIEREYREKDESRHVIN